VLVAVMTWVAWPVPAPGADEAADELAFEAFTKQVQEPSSVAPRAQPPRAEVADSLSDVGQQKQEQEQEQKKAKKSKKKEKKSKLKPAILVIVTNFDKADVTVNGRAYPEYYDDPDDQGMVLPAGGPYDIQVTFDGKTKRYTIGLRPYEKRIMVVELTGFKAGNKTPPNTPAPPTPKPPLAPPPAPEVEEKKADDKQGRVTVYSKPRGDIIIDGASKGKMTPNTVDTEPGRHEVQVKYEDGEVSEKKIVRVREGSRIKLFFRQRK
ncbi:MAG: PEGA domain-containing protein, partial [Myxococcota bacterium]